MTPTTNVENLQQYKSQFSLIIELILPFDSSPNMVREVKNLQVSNKYVTMFYVIKYSHSEN